MSSAQRLSRRGSFRSAASGLGAVPARNCSVRKRRPATRHRRNRSSSSTSSAAAAPDMFDLKPDAPAEIARPVAADRHERRRDSHLARRSPPASAKMMEQLSRSLPFASWQPGETTDAIQGSTARNPQKPKPGGGWPQLGSTVAKLQGPTGPGPCLRVVALLPVHARPVQRGGRVPGAGARPVPPDWDPPADDMLLAASRRPIGRPQDLTQDVRHRPPRCRRKRSDGGPRRVQRPSLRPPHSVKAGDGPRPIERKIRS